MTRTLIQVQLWVYSVVRKKVSVLLTTSLAWPAWAGFRLAELFSQLGTNFLPNLVVLCQKVRKYREKYRSYHYHPVSAG